MRSIARGGASIGVAASIGVRISSVFKPREASTLSLGEPSGYDARRRWLLGPAIAVSARDVEHLVNQATP
jgi:hypothetical protein